MGRLSEQLQQILDASVEKLDDSLHYEDVLRHVKTVLSQLLTRLKTINEDSFETVTSQLPTLNSLNGIINNLTSVHNSFTSKLDTFNIANQGYTDQIIDGPQFLDKSSEIVKGMRINFEKLYDLLKDIEQWENNIPEDIQIELSEFASKPITKDSFVPDNRRRVRNTYSFRPEFETRRPEFKQMEEEVVVDVEQRISFIETLLKKDTFHSIESFMNTMIKSIIDWRLIDALQLGMQYKGLIHVETEPEPNFFENGIKNLINKNYEKSEQFLIFLYDFCKSHNTKQFFKESFLNLNIILCQIYIRLSETVGLILGDDRQKYHNKFIIIAKDYLDKATDGIEKQSPKVQEQILIAQGIYYLSTDDDIKLAQEKFNAALILNPSSLHAHFGLGLIQELKLQLNEKAVELYKEAMNSIADPFSFDLEMLNKYGFKTTELLIYEVCNYLYEIYKTALFFENHDVETWLQNLLNYLIDITNSSHDFNFKSKIFELRGQIREFQKDWVKASDAYYQSSKNAYYSKCYEDAYIKAKKALNFEAMEIRQEELWHISDTLRLLIFTSENKYELLEEAVQYWEEAINMGFPTQKDVWAYVNRAGLYYLQTIIIPDRENILLKSEYNWRRGLLLERAILLSPNLDIPYSEIMNLYESFGMSYNGMFILKSYDDNLLHENSLYTIPIVEAKIIYYTNTSIYDQALKLIVEFVGLTEDQPMSLQWATMVKSFIALRKGEIDKSKGLIENKIKDIPLVLNNLWIFRFYSLILIEEMVTNDQYNKKNFDPLKMQLERIWAFKQGIDLYKDQYFELFMLTATLLYAFTGDTEFVDYIKKFVRNYEELVENKRILLFEDTKSMIMFYGGILKLIEGQNDYSELFLGSMTNTYLSEIYFRITILKAFSFGYKWRSINQNNDSLKMVQIVQQVINQASQISNHKLVKDNLKKEISIFAVNEINNKLRGLEEMVNISSPLKEIIKTVLYTAILRINCEMKIWDIKSLEQFDFIFSFHNDYGLMPEVGILLENYFDIAMEQIISHIQYNEKEQAKIIIDHIIKYYSMPLLNTVNIKYIKLFTSKGLIEILYENFDEGFAIWLKLVDLIDDNPSEFPYTDASNLVGTYLAEMLNVNLYWKISQIRSQNTLFANLDKLNLTRIKSILAMIYLYFVKNYDTKPEMLYSVDTPIVLTIGEDFIPINTNEWKFLQTDLPKMREEIELSLGTNVPGVRIRTDADNIQKNEYKILINEIPIYMNRIYQRKDGYILTTLTAKEATNLNITEFYTTNHPYSGTEITWIKEPKRRIIHRIKKIGQILELEPEDFFLEAIKSAILQHLDLLFDFQTFMNLLSKMKENNVDLEPYLEENASDTTRKYLLFSILKQMLISLRPINHFEFVLPLLKSEELLIDNVKPIVDKLLSNKQLSDISNKFFNQLQRTDLSKLTDGKITDDTNISEKDKKLIIDLILAKKDNLGIHIRIVKVNDWETMHWFNDVIRLQSPNLIAMIVDTNKI